MKHIIDLIKYIVGTLLLLAVMLLLYTYNIMLLVMGTALIILAALKLIDLKGFAKAYQKYNPLSKKVPLYAYVYPFLELYIGLSFLFSFALLPAAIVTLFIMTEGLIGILQKLNSGKTCKCACTGTKVRFPLTKFTVFENIAMILMALVLISRFI